MVASTVLMAVTSAVTLTDSLTDPSSSLISSVAGVLTCSGRSLFIIVLKPGFSTLISYLPGAACRN
jgi:hypothetical protein